ncbi:type VI secretion system protein TssA [Pollutimonas harenae]|uniref:Type VI secretion system protein TssA n=1 Tax=Pollutimonas harenae TaxID=657015 RepID=A0A853H2H1_9BURK|nr:type VI secretion system protein TssA [Pollutimonas harenae]NYT86472.1 type VI secretion system protein TssA [Pollutimonas harenae]TEA69782.1 type VI secretion system protein TssA [Pollutimonas harenae]
MAALADLFNTFATSSSCGENLEYSPEFLALQQAVAGKPEQQFGSTIIPEQAPDWALIEREAAELSERTCDIRIIVLLTQAWTELKGLPGFADGIQLLATVLDRHWDHVYPLLLLDGEHDPMPRMNALVALGDKQGAARSVRSASLLHGAHGQMSVREAEALLEGSKTQSETYPGGRPRLVEALRHARLLEAPELLAVTQALAGLQAIEDTVTFRIGSEWVPDFMSVRRTLAMIASVTEAAVEAIQPDAAPSSGSDMDSGSVDAAELQDSAGMRSVAVGAWREAVIQTRDDALLALEKASLYFERYEPSHPAPFLIRRAQQTIPLDFYEMLKNLAPQGLDQFEAWVPKSGAE